MGLIIIFGVLFIISIIICVVGTKCYNEGVSILSMLSAIVFGCAFIVATVIALTVQIPKNKDYEQSVYEKSVIEYRLEHQQDNIVGNELLYNDIVSYNNHLRAHKRYSDNFMLNLFYNDKIATIEYISIEGVENYKD